MTKKVLVTYATKAGSTAEIAKTIGEGLAAQDVSVDVRPLKNVTDVDGYDAVVLGSAVRFGSWLPETVKFVERNREALIRVPTAFFAVHILNMGEDETSRANRQAYLNPVRKILKPTREAFFAGVGDMSKVSFIEGLIGKMVKSPEGDYRDWAAIRAWAESLKEIL